MNYDISCYIACPPDSTTETQGRLLAYIRDFLHNLEDDGIEYAIDVRNVYDARTEFRRVYVDTRQITQDLQKMIKDDDLPLQRASERNGLAV